MNLWQAVQIAAASLLLAISIKVSGSRSEQDRGQLEMIRTCSVTGGGELQVCHLAAAERIFYQPSRSQVAYNTQIIALGAGKYATVLHSESRDMSRYRLATGHVRPGDSIKTGVDDATTDPEAAYRVPASIDFRIWGSLTNPRSPLYYEYNPSYPAARGLSGGGNPMVVRGRKADGDPFFYMFFLGVSSDGLAGTAWRNILLEARTQDFRQFNLLQRDELGRPVWIPFSGESARPAVVTDAAGHPIVSNHPASIEKGGSTHPHRPVGAVATAGEIGSIVRVNGLYYYFYTDQDVIDPARNHLYVVPPMMSRLTACGPIPKH